MAIPNSTFRAFIQKLGNSDPSTFVGNEGDIFWDPNTGELRRSDGSTPGGVTLTGGGTALKPGDNVSELVNDTNYLVESDVTTILSNGGYITGVDNLDDIGDVSVAGATSNQYLLYNGTNWVAQTLEISSGIDLKGSIDCTSQEAPGSPVVGDFYFNTGDGAALSSWTGLTTVTDGDRIVYTATNVWQVFGNLNDSGSLGLDDFSVSKENASGGGDLSYNNSNGVFTFTPADLTAVQWSDVQNKPSLYTSNSYITSLPVLS